SRPPDAAATGNPGPAPILASCDHARLRALARRLASISDTVAEALAAKLEACRVVPPDAVPPAVATLGARIIFAVEGRAPEARMLVMPEEHREARRTLSVATPLGLALLGLAAGQRAEATERGGRRLALRLLAVDLPRAAGRGEASPIQPRAGGVPPDTPPRPDPPRPPLPPSPPAAA